ncbi:M20/M25/M40 family metallo-hydrolase [Actinoplanes sp. NPDC051851]|uniref:M20/M25/M40 family metallo-hydrolase n=1 Tax=Actinoplanes sp. NPDC051851 TaxID=3154753 RepID=UPI003432310D
MDAVPPDDQIGGGTAPAHLCGHDLHTTIGIGVAESLARGRRRLSGRVMFVFQPAEETLSGAAAMFADGVFATIRPSEIHALHCFAMPVGRFVTTAGFGLPGRDRGVAVTGSDEEAAAVAAALNGLSTVARPATPADLERLVNDVLTPHGPLERFVFVQARAADSQVQVTFRCWPEERYRDVRESIRALAPTVVFPSDPFPAMVTPEREGHALQRFLNALPAYGSIPFSGEDFALFLNEMPGTYTFLGVRRPGAPIETSYPHFATFDPDERAIGHGVRAMTSWLTHRAAMTGITR